MRPAVRIPFAPATRQCEPEVPFVFPRLKVAAKVVGDLNRKAVLFVGEGLLRISFHRGRGPFRTWARVFRSFCQSGTLLTSPFFHLATVCRPASDSQPGSCAVPLPELPRSSIS